MLKKLDRDIIMAADYPHLKAFFDMIIEKQKEKIVLLVQ